MMELFFSFLSQYLKTILSLPSCPYNYSFNNSNIETSTKNIDPLLWFGLVYGV